MDHRSAGKGQNHWAVQPAQILGYDHQMLIKVAKVVYNGHPS